VEEPRKQGLEAFEWKTKLAEKGSWLLGQNKKKLATSSRIPLELL